MTYLDIEAKANNVLALEKITAPAVNVARIAEFRFGLDFDWIDMGDRSEEGTILAALCVKENKIYMNAALEAGLRDNHGRMNFTIAHEIGHFVLHEGLERERLSGVKGKFFIYKGAERATNNLERQANLFATYLLMPKKFIEVEIQKLLFPLSWYDIRDLAEQFCVSTQAMTIRLVDELKLLYPARDGLYYESENAFLEAGGQQRLF